ncbi:MAG: DtxR family iron (metal) dependent repressor, partial [Planctomyces sp.]|nr:DtxR family iron (metal) dependent repressor [Planctomyces sp.]
MASLTVENYLKAILLLGFRSGQTTIATGQLAEALEVSPGTVTSMLKTLADSDLVNYKPYAGVTLTASGRKLALRMLRRHRLIELFLVNTLNLTWDQVHEEAEHMEHAVSDLLVDRIDEYLGKPDVDPHGDPIPRGTAASTPERMDEYHTLSTFPTGVSFRVTRVL